MADTLNREASLDDESERLRKHNRILEDSMDPDYGLLDQLLSLGVLSRREVHDVKSERTFEKRNAQIIEYVSLNRRLEKLVLALRNTNQKHLANYLTSDGVHQPEFSDEWPLEEWQTAAMNRNQMTLVDSLGEVDELCLAMLSAGIINVRHKETIRCQPTYHEKTEVLLDMMIRQSKANYTKTMDFFKANGRNDLVEILSCRGVVVKVIANFGTSETGEIMKNIENDISNGINNQLLHNQSSPGNAEAISELESINLIAAQPGHSVALYFDCRCLQELTHLWTLMGSGRLKDIVEKYVNRLLLKEDEYKVRLKWSADDYAVKQSILNEGDPRPSPPVEITVKVDSTPGVWTRKVPGRVFGVTKLKNLIYVLGRSPDVVYVFSDEHPFSEKPYIKLKTELKFEGFDICACSKTSCLYVSDSCNRRVFKIPVNDPDQMICWLKDAVRPPCTLSVCRFSGDVIMARNEEPVGLELYDSKAVNICSVRLSENAITPRHAVSISEESFVVIHKWKESGAWGLSEANSGAWGLSEVNRKGETVRCFKGNVEEKCKSLGNPWHLALDEDGGLIVLDQMKKQVIRFDRHLNWQDVLLSKNELEVPLRLCYDMEKRQLIVGQENGSVGIYRV